MHIRKGDVLWFKARDGVLVTFSGSHVIVRHVMPSFRKLRLVVVPFEPLSCVEEELPTSDAGLMHETALFSADLTHHYGELFDDLYAAHNLNYAVEIKRSLLRADVVEIIGHIDMSAVERKFSTHPDALVQKDRVLINKRDWYRAYDGVLHTAYQVMDHSLNDVSESWVGH